MAVASSIPYVSLTDLLQKVGIDQERLDKSVSGDHLLQMSQFLTSRERLAPLLGLDESDREVIEADGKGEENKRLMMLERWRSRYAFKSTYRKLVDALLGLKMADHALKVCRLLRPEATDSGGFLERKLNSAFIIATRGTVQVLKEKWAKLCRIVHQRLNDKNVKVEDVANYIGDQIYIRVSVPNSSFTEIFSTLRVIGLWNFFSCALLWSIVNEYLPEDGELSSLISSYKSDLKDFKSKTKVIHFIPIINTELSKDVSILDQHYKPYTFEGDVDSKDITLIDVERVWETQMDILSLPELHKGLLQFIREGSVHVTYLIPAKIIPEVIARVQESSTKFFHQQGILSIVIDKEMVYSQLSHVTEYPDLESAIVQAARMKSGRSDLGIHNVLDLEQFWSAISIERKLGSSSKSIVPYGEDEEYVNDTDDIKTFDRSLKSKESVSSATKTHRETKKVNQPVIRLRPRTKLMIKKYKETKKRRVVVKVKSDYTVRFEYSKRISRGALAAGVAASMSAIGAGAGAGAVGGAVGGGVVGGVIGVVIGGVIGGTIGALAGSVTIRPAQLALRQKITAKDIFAMLPRYQERGDYVTCEVLICKFHYSDKKEYKRIPHHYVSKQFTV